MPTLLMSFLLVYSGTANAQSVTNGDFEESLRGGGVGYISQGSTIADWISTNNAVAGIQRTDAGSNPFANNGAFPSGSAVAFIQATTADPSTTLSSTITGLTVGAEYEVQYRVNARLTPGLPTPTALLSIGGSPLVGANINPVGGANPYRTISRSFVATASSVPISVTAGLATGTDATVLIDDFQVVQRDSPWSVSAWNDDATSGIDTTLNSYTHAFNFGTATSAVDTTINGQLFTGVAGANPSVGGSFAITDRPNAGDDTANNINSGGSSDLADGFNFNGSGTELTLEGLTDGVTYTTSFYTVGFDASGFRTSTFESDGDLFTVDVNEFGNNNGLRLDYTFVADGSSRTISLSPLQGDQNSFHLHGFANAVAITTPVPEPTSGLLICFTGCTALLRRRRA